MTTNEVMSTGSTALNAVVATLVLYAVVFLLQRLVFHPLARFPGPKLAALTSLYEDYFEVSKNYDYIWEIRKMHAKYGPIVRINPHEIHINDPEYYSTLNSFKGHWDKDPHTALQFANPHASVGTVPHDLHKQRKAAIQPFFAKQKIYELEPVIAEKAQQLCTRLGEYSASQQVVPMRQALKCYCVDTIAEYCFAKCSNMLDKPNFAVEYWANVAQGLDAGIRARFMPKWFMPTVKQAPAWIRSAIGPGVDHFEAWHTATTSAVDHVESKKGEEASSTGVSVHRTVFQEILNNPRLAPEEKTRTRILQEGAALIGAGGETTSQVLGIIIYGLLEDQAKLKTLQAELRAAEVDAELGIPNLRSLEALPYMTGCLKEGLRLRTGKVGRQQRVPVGKSLYYGDVEIKPGTICSMTPAFSHIDPEVFPEPYEFRPERWLDLSDEERIRMDRYLVAYSKGPRNCTAFTLANAMIYFGVAALAGRFDMSLYETTKYDNEMAADAERHYPLKESKGLRIKVQSLEK